ncbi:hypothetical protein [Sansalvadorimonas verongulae]|uniref:hypothetical protein n=1 Tax=Sansalvadorimonas verongulae TaxID=2172824 RepID=UPI0012BD63D1|nr:hypothetical protein [Sansalvadorimonas verongulae]MTI12135.1 hypothetical protein [Sansalvadorimonas verongulae]
MSKRKNPNDMPEVPVSTDCMIIVASITLLALQISTNKSNSLVVTVTVSGAIDHVDVWVRDEAIADPIERTVFNASVYLKYKPSKKWLQDVESRMLALIGEEEAA